MIDERHEKLIGFLHRKVWVYSIDGTPATYDTYNKVKGVPDLRPYAVAHPRLNTIQQLGGLAGGAISAGSYLLKRGK